MARFYLTVILAAMVLSGRWVTAADWVRFRGPQGAGVSDKPVPTKWGDKENLKWKLALPGPGASSPIVVGDQIFVTCWTGYAAGDDEGSLKDLARVLVCVDRKAGTIRWQKSIPAVLPEDEFRGMFAENGYATHTPVSDGERVYVFFGKSGVFAFDLKGEQLWKAEVGKELDQRGWGSASSPILYKNLLIVPAVVESHSLIALDKITGKEVWKQEAEGFGSTWGTPILVDLPDKSQELVFGVPFEIWGFNPDTGKLKWYANGPESNSMCSSVVAADGVIYAAESGPGGGGTIAVRAGGKDDVTKTHTVWSGRDRSRVATPVVHQGHLYWVSSGVVNCVDAKTGNRVYQERLARPARGEGGDAQPGRRNQGRGGFGGGFGGGGRRGGQDYASPVVADGKMYYITRGGDCHVIELGKEFKQLGTNRFSDPGQYMATPAISDGQLFLRSDKFLYCIEA